MPILVHIQHVCSDLYCLLVVIVRTFPVFGSPVVCNLIIHEEFALCLGRRFADLHAHSLFLLVEKTPRDFCIVSVTSSKTQ